MIANDIRKVSVVFSDPTADAVIPILRVPADHQYTIEEGFASILAQVAAATDAYINLTLVNMGTAGAGTDEISDSIGGTSGWAANAIKDFTVVAGSGKLTAGQILGVKYAETGTVAPKPTTVEIGYVDGIGSKANA